jgi:hypothetical protein
MNIKQRNTTLIIEPNDINDKLNKLYKQQQQIQEQILELKNMANKQIILNSNKNNIYIDLKSSNDLGYLIFNIVATLAYSYKYNLNIKLINYSNKYQIFKSLEYNEYNDNNCINITELNDNYYNKINLESKTNYLLNGKFRSYKYSEKYIDKIKLYLFDNIKDYILPINKLFNDKKNNMKTILLYLNNIDEYYNNALDIFFKNNNINEYKIFLLSDTKINNNKYNIEIINEENSEKLLILLTLFDHYIIHDNNLALMGYYFRNNIKATISLLPNNNSNLLNYNDIIPDSKLYINIMKKLNNTFIINLESRIDNKINSIKELNKISNNPQIYKVPNDTNLNISISQINILKKAIDLNLEYVIIANDEIKILNESYILYSIDKIMTDCVWNVIIISGIGIDTKINNFYSSVISMQSPICYCVNNKYYQTLLNNLIEGYNKLLIQPSNIIYSFDEYWKRLQQNDKWYSITEKYVYVHNNYYTDKTNMINYIQLFNIKNINNCEYLDYIPIIEMSNINMIYDINPIFHNSKYIIINLYCSKIERSFIKFSIDLLKKNNYELIHLQKPYNKIMVTDNTEIFTNISLNSSCAYLLNNYLLKKIINNKNYIVNNNFNYNLLRAAELIFPIFFDCNDNKWIEYYNKINQK